MRKVIGPVEVYLVEDDVAGASTQYLEVVLRAHDRPALVWRLEVAAVLHSGEEVWVEVGAVPASPRGLDP